MKAIVPFLVPLPLIILTWFAVAEQDPDRPGPGETPNTAPATAAAEGAGKLSVGPSSLGRRGQTVSFLIHLLLALLTWFAMAEQVLGRSGAG